MPSRGIHHVDLAVADVERSLAFYLDLLGPLGWKESVRYPSYRGTEEVVYLKDAATGSLLDPGSDSSMFGIRSADGPAHRYYGVGIEHFAFDPDGIRVEVFCWSRP
jgi:catechol 2,3-dioxygenase-like lactoylglutathione lyase family enzyme